MSEKIIKLIKQAFHFFAISGVGWIVDMCIYTILSKWIPVTIANIISSTTAVTYVYTVSTKKIFENKSNINIRTKYIFYIIYQMALILLSSVVISGLSHLLLVHFRKVKFITKYAKICAKILITPFTMVMNFLFMKILIEKI